MTRKPDAYRSTERAKFTGRGNGKPRVSGVGAKRKTLTKQDVDATRNGQKNATSTFSYHSQEPTRLPPGCPCNCSDSVNDADRGLK